ncbi:Glucoamylase (glucan-1,4-alpha-glucosidase), GH15 family [Rubritalea squalenifaciens DSM 18772]|uniref:Glucoamylase (Glucan-1,4-alpha-glucosidase), GH15 family n=1 Tax=Rubritalea squalenifaciens DSM 18772 TaxID=1123071 RepID=A0A1M6IV78_9BACT|nr:glycoside hydrolase family 15 protein [Rubritalea squalenifaciens]SHJ38366.1 Glucoamylase (glucan-1,4-alpha-glucosidase), GH15 family [Rubritalea squalenifaciens DSM 18772]
MDLSSDYHHGIIGNGRTCAIIDADSSIVFSCMPDFDSGTIFAKMLDEKKGGHFTIRMQSGKIVSQEYEKNTGILKTVFKGKSGSFELIDFMPRYSWDGRSGTKKEVSADIVRVLKPLSGNPEIIVDYNPQLEYARFNTKSFKFGRNRIKTTTGGTCPSGKTIYESCYLYSSIASDKILKKEAFKLTEQKFLLLSYHDKVISPDEERVELMLQRTRSYWLLWSARTHRCDQYSEEILRSAITLKMLQFSPTGAVVAAATTSLPETIGEERNWDYRFCWIRDGSMTVDVLNRIGHPSMAGSFIHWVMETVPTKDDALQIMYGIRGEKTLTEEALGHLEGYQGSSPVRIGNAAYHQQQHDIYGILMDLIYKELIQHDLGDRHPAPETLDQLWTRVRSIVKTVGEFWKDPDRGIWEIRGEAKHFVFSKVLCWVAVDRAIKIGNMLKKYDWAKQHEALRDEIHNDICTKGWSKKKKAFTQVYGSDDLDSANLLMADYGFIDPMDKRFISTVEQSEKELCRGGLMYRYKNQDDFGEPSSAFTVCSFWMVKALARTGKRAQAQRRFRQLLKFANPKGLYGEDLDFKTKRHLGNFPQAYSHLALIDCALELSEDCHDYLIEE